MMGVPKALWIALGSGLVLLAVAGATGAVENSLRDNYNADCADRGFYGGPRTPPSEDPKDVNETNEDATPTPEPTATPEERQACRDARLPVTVADALFRATLGPGIALVAVGAFFLIGVAIGGRRRP